MICDELDWGSSQISWQLFNPSQWFVMNFSQAHHKSAGNLLIPASDLWWAPVICDELQSGSSQISWQLVIQPVICDELQSGSSQISWQLVNPSQWFVMNLTEVHRKSIPHGCSSQNDLSKETWICDEPDWGSSQITLFPRHRYEKNQWKNWSKVLKTVWFCDEPQSSSSQTEVVPPILICDEQQLHSSEIQVHGHLRFRRSLAMGSTEIESFVMSVMPQGILDQRICEGNSSQTHDHSCKSNLRHLSTNSASFCGQGTWSPAALQVPSFFLHFVRTRLGRWLQSFTVTVIRLTSVCAFSVLKSTDFLCWKAQLKIALFSLLFLQNNWQAWLLTNYKETCQQYSWWKVGSHATYQTFPSPVIIGSQENTRQ